MDALRTLDHAVAAWFRSVRQPDSRLTGAILDVSAAGGPCILSLVVLFTVGLLLSLRRRRTAGFVLVAALGAGMLSSTIKLLVGRHRPLLPLPGAGVYDVARSFPSGHSLGSTAIYLTLALVAGAVIPSRRVRAYVVTASVVLAALIGLSRLYLGVHYLTDVLAGWATGLVWALLCRWIEGRWVLLAERRAAAAEARRSALPI